MQTVNVTPQNSIAVVCGCDDNYTMPLAVSLYSTLVNLEPNTTIYIYIIDGGITDKSKAKLQRVLNVKHVDVHVEWVVPNNLSSLSQLKTHEWITAASYLRLFIPEVIPEQFDKVIYLDCDLQVEGNIKQLWDMEMGEYALLAARDMGTPYISSPFGIKKYQELGLKPDAPYFNAGVLVINLKRWRAEQISQRVTKYLQDYKEYVQLMDQDGLNAILSQDWGELDQKWNVVSHILNYDEWDESPFKNEINQRREALINNAYIYHYAGGSKPWQIGCLHPQQQRWVSYLKASQWFEPAESLLWQAKWLPQYYAWRMKRLVRQIVLVMVKPITKEKLFSFS